MFTSRNHHMLMHTELKGVFYMFDSLISTGFTAINIFICLSVSILCGIAIAMTYRLTEHPSRNFSTAVAILPAIVMMVILMVNGNIGVGVAVAPHPLGFGG